MKCSKCGRDIIAEKPFKITNSDKEEDLLFCKVCIKQAFNTLSLKKIKTPDEISLLSNIRKFLKQKSN